MLNLNKKLQQEITKSFKGLFSTLKFSGDFVPDTTPESFRITTFALVNGSCVATLEASYISCVGESGYDQQEVVMIYNGFVKGEGFTKRWEAFNKKTELSEIKERINCRQFTIIED